MLQQQIETYVTRTLGGAHQKQWAFHNIHHVKLVVAKCIELAQAHKLDQQMTDELLVAAWFHDIGYSSGSADHEARSATICQTFLSDYEVSPAFINHVATLIRATQYPSHPVDIQQKILCDADLYHLASDSYPQWASRLYTETKLHHNHELTEQDWQQTNIEFFKNHSYFTDYAMRDWTPQKLKNLMTLEHLIQRNEEIPKSGRPL